MRKESSGECSSRRSRAVRESEAESVIGHEAAARVMVIPDFLHGAATPEHRKRLVVFPARDAISPISAL
jgi:hypothetical protein